MAGDPFDSAFDTLTREDKTKGPQADVANPAPAPEAPAAPEPVAPVAEAVEPPAPEEPPVEGAEGEEAPTELEEAEPEAPKPSMDETLTRLADVLEQRRAAAAAQPQPQPQPQAPPPVSPFSQEDATFLQQYTNDFPDVARAESLIRRAEYNVLTQHIFQQVAGAFAPRLALLEQLADGAAYGALAQRVPNYDDQRDKVVEWVKTHPGYLQEGMNRVISQGTVDEIADLFGRYEQATGQQAPSASGLAPAQPGAKVAPAAQVPELSPAAKQAAARLAPVSGKRSAPTQGAPLTFDAAFADFSKAG